VIKRERLQLFIQLNIKTYKSFKYSAFNLYYILYNCYHTTIIIMIWFDFVIKMGCVSYKYCKNNEVYNPVMCFILMMHSNDNVGEVIS